MSGNGDKSQGSQGHFFQDVCQVMEVKEKSGISFFPQKSQGIQTKVMEKSEKLF